MDTLTKKPLVLEQSSRDISRQSSTSFGSLMRIMDFSLMIGGMLVIGRYQSETVGLEWLLLYGCIGWILYHAGASYLNFYGSWRVFSLLRELTHVALIWFIAFSCVALTALLLFDDETHVRDVILPWGVVVATGMLSYRSLVRLFLHRLRELGINNHNVAIVGCGPSAERLKKGFESAPWMGFRVVGQFDKSQVANGASETLDVQEMIHLAHSGQIDRTYVTWEMSREADIRQLIEALADTTVSLYLIPDLLVSDLMYSRVEPINDVITVSIYDTPVYGPTGSLKRIEDIVLSLAILGIVSLPMLVIALAVKLTSPGPVLFKQTRYGLDGRPIRVYKFRTMKVMEDGDVVTQATRSDKRLTPVGGFLRRTSLDELPQFINVLQGRMSIVGPRPHAVAHNEQYRGLIHGYMLRHKVKPGITGWAQINGWRGETDTLEKMQKRVELDHDYIRHWSLAFDLKIILLTVFRGFVDKNAY
ncbi:putative colanic acid biosysnthesis UDP-glucose lipid carrier transferase [Modicisalibacter xianhensis]|uniref:Putative colanic acid biosysnthesis UDP-glucose lipid carrier transferase n=2 Tax=Modicisalibacter xianhensis TaxID=442341 RepID=A0A1I2ZF09_9GAMM|nr:putative colanic acid biosysnthesis UDP-glucose lipid carrier transferase [Halomonas xianhensis]